MPEIADPMTFDVWLSRPRDGTGLLLVEPSAGRAEPLPVRALSALAPPASATLAVGPEGGWTRAEVDAAIAAGYTVVLLWQHWIALLLGAFLFVAWSTLSLPATFTVSTRTAWLSTL